MTLLHIHGMSTIEKVPSWHSGDSLSSCLMFIKSLLQRKSRVVKRVFLCHLVQLLQSRQERTPKSKYLTCAQFPVNSRLGPRNYHWGNCEGLPSNSTLKILEKGDRGRGSHERAMPKSEHCKWEMSRTPGRDNTVTVIYPWLSCTEINSPSLNSSSCSANSSELHIPFVVKAETYSGSSSKTVKTLSILKNLTWPNLDGMFFSWWWQVNTWV